MAGTREGAEKAARTRKEKDPNAFQDMGQKGGSSPKNPHHNQYTNKEDNK